jgi:hypothetical protein
MEKEAMDGITLEQAVRDVARTMLERAALVVDDADGAERLEDSAVTMLCLIDDD